MRAGELVEHALERLAVAVIDAADGFESFKANAGAVVICLGGGYGGLVVGGEGHVIARCTLCHGSCTRMR